MVIWSIQNKVGFQDYPNKENSGIHCEHKKTLVNGTKRNFPIYQANPSSSRVPRAAMGESSPSKRNLFFPYHQWPGAPCGNHHSTPWHMVRCDITKAGQENEQAELAAQKSGPMASGTVLVAGATTFSHQGIHFHWWTRAWAQEEVTGATKAPIIPKPVIGQQRTGSAFCVQPHNKNGGTTIVCHALAASIATWSSTHTASQHKT